VIDRFSQQYPGVILRVILADQFALRDCELRQRNVELAIAPTDGLVPDADTDTEVLFDDRQVIVAGVHSKWARRRKIALEDLIDEPWILQPPESGMGSAIAKAFRAAGLEPSEAQIVTFSVPLCQNLVATGRFITMLPVSVVRVSKHSPLKLLPVALPEILRTVGIMTLKNRLLSPLAQLFIECAREVAKPLAAAGRRVRVG
jgi:DNA-binding transcriptional LysR family regulator